MIGLEANIDDGTGSLTDPQEIHAVVSHPDGYNELVTDSEHISTGRYRFYILLDEPGTWTVSIQATNPTVATVTTVIADDSPRPAAA